MRASRRFIGAAALLIALAGRPAAQEEAPAAPAAEAPPPRPKPRPKPKPKVEPRPELRTEEPTPAAPEPEPPAAPPSRSTFAAPSIACDPGQSVLFEGARGFSVWVTRSGSVTIDNPLRPLTPDVTRVLQLVIAGKLASAYGADFLALRRGASPAALEGTLGGPIRWDATLATLPETLNVVADSGATLAELRFKTCGEAPAAQAAPVAKAKSTAPKSAASKPVRRKPPSAEPGAAPPPQAAPGPAPNLPRGALSE